MNALTGETVSSGVYSRELCSFFLLAPNWMPFSTVPSKNPEPLDPEAIKKKEKEKEKEAEREKEKAKDREKKIAALSKPIPKKKPETTNSLRQANRTHMETAVVARIDRMKLKGIDRKEMKDLVDQLEEMLFDKCDRNISHPKYRVWKQQFIHNFEAESAKDFVTAVVLKRLSVEKLIALDANSLRNPMCWKIKPVGGLTQAKRRSNASKNVSYFKNFAPRVRFPVSTRQILIKYDKVCAFKL